MPESQSFAPMTAWIPGSGPGMTKTGEQGGTPNPQRDRQHPAHAGPHRPTRFPRAISARRGKTARQRAEPVPAHLDTSSSSGLTRGSMPEPQSSAPATAWIPRSGPGMTKSEIKARRAGPSALQDTLLTGVTRRRRSCARSSSPGFPGAASRRGPEPGFRCRGRWQRNPLPSWHASHARFPAR